MKRFGGCRLRYIAAATSDRKEFNDGWRQTTARKLDPKEGKRPQCALDQREFLSPLTTDLMIEGKSLRDTAFKVELGRTSVCCAIHTARLS